MSNNLPFDLSSHNYHVQEVVHNQTGERIGFIYLFRPVPVDLESVRFVPMENSASPSADSGFSGTGDVSCSSHNATIEDNRNLVKTDLDTDGPNDPREVEIVEIKEEKEKHDRSSEDMDNFRSTKFNNYKENPSPSPNYHIKSSAIINSGIPDLSLLIKPAVEGWRRECAMRYKRVTRVYYLTPPDKSGHSKRLTNLSTVMSEIGPNSRLVRENFSFTSKVLGLPPYFEIVRHSIRVINSHPSAFKEHYIDCETTTARGTRMVQCKLCGHKGSYHNFSTHMRKYHLPDEECLTCGEEVSPMQMLNHVKTKHMNNTKIVGRKIMSEMSKGKEGESTSTSTSISVKSEINENPNQISTESGSPNVSKFDISSSSKFKSFELTFDKKVKAQLKGPSREDASLASDSLLTDINTNIVVKGPSLSIDSDNADENSIPVIEKPDVPASLDVGCIPLTIASPGDAPASSTISTSCVFSPPALSAAYSSIHTSVTDKLVTSTATQLVGASTASSPTSTSINCKKELMFICINPKSRKRIQIGGKKPVGKAMNMFSNVTGLSSNEFQFKCQNNLLTGEEIVASLPTFVINVEKI